MVARSAGVSEAHVASYTMWDFCRKPETDFAMNLPALLSSGIRGAVFLGLHDELEERMRGLVGKVARHGYRAKLVKAPDLIVSLKENDSPGGLVVVEGLCDQVSPSPWDADKVVSWLVGRQEPVVFSTMNLKVLAAVYGRRLAGWVENSYCPIPC